MTLIVNAAALGRVFQVSDRLVTLGARPYDVYANKTVIYRASDAIVSISYTGPAYIRGIPTDQWIAEVLRNENLSDVHLWTMVHQPHHLPDIGWVAELLRRESVEAIADLRRHKSIDISLEIYITGWRWKTKRYIDQDYTHFYALLWTITLTDENSIRFDILRQPSRRWDGNGQFCVVAGDIIGQIHFAWMRNELKNLRYFSPEEFESILINTTRRVASGNPKVGTDCLATQIFFTLDKRRIYYQIILKCDPLKDIKYAPKEIRDKSHPVVAFTPWIILPHHILAPTVHSGGGVWDFDDLRIELQIPDSMVGSGEWIQFMKRHYGKQAPRGNIGTPRIRPPLRATLAIDNFGVIPRTLASPLSDSTGPNS